jgi:hypothetical protein
MNLLSNFYARVVLILSWAFFLSATQIHAQTQRIVISEEQCLEGTYEIISKGKTQEVFTTDILKEIEKRRDDAKEVLYDVSEYTTIRIFPRSIIKSPAYFSRPDHY